MVGRVESLAEVQAPVAASSLVLFLVGFAGWAMRVATVGFGADLAGAPEVLLAQAVLVVPIFTGLGWLYIRTVGQLRPRHLASAMGGVVFALDFSLVAVLVAGDLGIFANPLATWIPYALVVSSTWLGGESAGRPYCA